MKPGLRVVAHAIVPLSLALAPSTGRCDPPTAAPAARLHVQLGHTDRVVAAAFSPDGRYLATAGWDNTARLWEAASGRELRQFMAHGAWVLAVAFSPDGRRILTGSRDTHAALWDVATGELVRAFGPLDGQVTAVALSPDGRLALTRTDFTTTLWSLETGKPQLELPGSYGAPAFSPDSRSVLLGAEDEVRLLDVAKGQTVRVLRDRALGPPHAMAFSPGGRRAMTGHPGEAVLWDLDSGKALRRFPVLGDATAFCFSPDGRRALTESMDGVAEWDLASGDELGRLERHSSSGMACSADGREVAIHAAVGETVLWDVATRSPRRTFQGFGRNVESLAVSRDGKYLLTGSQAGSAFLWDLAAGRLVKRLNVPADATEPKMSGGTVASLSPDGRHVLVSGFYSRVACVFAVAGGDTVGCLTGSARFFSDGGLILPASSRWDLSATPTIRRTTASVPADLTLFSTDGRYGVGVGGVARVWDFGAGREVARYDGHEKEDLSTWVSENPLFHKMLVRRISSAALSPDGLSVLTGGFDGSARLWAIDGGHEQRRFLGHTAGISGVAFSPDGHFVLTGSTDRTARLWDAATGAPVRVFSGHTAPVTAVAFTADGRFVLSGSVDQTTHVFDAGTGTELARLVGLSDGTGVVVASDGRFDTNDLDEIRGLHWALADDPLRPLPLEIFMRDYYEPRLLPRLMAGETLPPLRNLADLNRIQPGVAIEGVRLDDVQAGLLSVTIEVASATGRSPAAPSGAYDLRVFRDGHLVAQVPEDPQAFDAPATREAELAQWRKTHEIAVDPATGRRTVTIRGLRVSRAAGARAVEISAYAFNADRVKSATARRRIEVPAPRAPRRGRAYVVSVGVNAFAGDARSRLFYAANDARRMSAVLARRLAAVRAPETGRPRFEEVIPIVLVTDAAKGGGPSPFLVDHATKDRVRAVLERLAGASDDGGRLAGVEGAARLRPARPEDFVLLYFSTHGEADARGRFYVMPSDLGPRGSAADVLRRAISSDDLSAWLRPVDAGDLVMVLDTCQSAAAVDGGGFKPGPMGSRGLGQLAYDKGMVILAASQRDQSAIEAAQIRQGLLGYALVREGLEEGAADFRPSDEQILLSEWLAYGSERVPGLYRAVHDGTLAAKGVEPVIEGVEPPAELQQPALFDFRHGLDRVLVETKGRPDARPPSPATAGAKGARRLGAAAVAERWIPPGRIRIGPGDADGDGALSRDEVVAGFYLDRTEVTVEAYDACVRAGACSAPGKDPYCNEGVAARRKHPINCVSATQADAYCAWTGKRLPTEVEWEYAARGPGGRRFPWGEDPPSDQLCWNRHATASSATASTADSGTCEVGQYPDETFGLKDMGGNLTEWTSSPSRLSYASAWTDPSTRMIRGSSFANSTHGGAYSDELERAWHRERYTAHIGAGHIGFRCARGAR